MRNRIFRKVGQLVLFEDPLLQRDAIYPCTLDDLESQVRAFNDSEIEGLRAIGLVPQSRRFQANARYFFRRRLVHLYNIDRLCRIKAPRRVIPDPESAFYHQIQFGMEFEKLGGNWLCRWRTEDLKRFILEHVLAHEIGHHIYHRTRLEKGLVHRPNTRESEQFAEAYAARWRSRNHRSSQ